MFEKNTAKYINMKKRFDMKKQKKFLEKLNNKSIKNKNLFKNEFMEKIKKEKISQ